MNIKSMNTNLSRTLPVLIPLIIIAMVLKVWFWMSLITSGVVAYKGACSEAEWKIERVVAGRWFCPDTTVKVIK